MLFRPSFCSNCGEKIERAEWHLWTSRRFCDLCATEMPVHEYAPKIAVAVGIFATIVGLGSYLGTGTNGVGTPLTRQRRVENSNLDARSVVSTPVPVVNGNISDTNAGPAVQAPRTLAALPPKPEATVKTVVDDQYFCGAQTKKGTPCSRRVKGNVRCFQHQGMPAMVTGDKLRVG